jgi:hypothetical protein
MSNTNAMKQLRGPKHENWPVCDPRAPAPPGEYGLKSGENGHLARANGAIDGPDIAHQRGPVCLEGGVSRWLVGVVGLGAGLLQRPQAARGALLLFECLRKTRGVQAFRCGPGRPGRDGWACSCYREGRSKAVAFYNSQALSNVQEESLSCARGQVVVARPPVLTPPWCYRRSLVSKGRFTMSINVICVGIRSSPPKRRYRVVIDYVVGDPLRHRGKAGCWLFRGL